MDTTKGKVLLLNVEICSTMPVGAVPSEGETKPKDQIVKVQNNEIMSKTFKEKYNNFKMEYLEVRADGTVTKDRMVRNLLHQISIDSSQLFSATELLKLYCFSKNSDANSRLQFVISECVEFAMSFAHSTNCIKGIMDCLLKAKPLDEKATEPVTDYFAVKVKEIADIHKNLIDMSYGPSKLRLMIILCANMLTSAKYTYMDKACIIDCFLKIAKTMIEKKSIGNLRTICEMLSVCGKMMSAYNRVEVAVVLDLLKPIATKTPQLPEVTKFINELLLKSLEWEQ